MDNKNTPNRPEPEAALSWVPKKIHPAIDINNSVHIGVWLPDKNSEYKDTLFFIDDKKEIIPFTKRKLSTTPLYFPLRWSSSSIKKYLDEESTSPELKEICNNLIKSSKRYLHETDDRWHTFNAVGIILTYYYKLFNAVAYVHVNGPYGSGKSQYLDWVSATAFNAFYTIGATAATIFRMVDGINPTLIIDEAEEFNKPQRSMGDDTRAKISIAAAGYKKNAAVPRCNMLKGKIEFFKTYCPKYLASVNQLPYILQCRSIRKNMLKTKKRYPPIDVDSEEFQIIRDKLYLSIFDSVDRVKKRRKIFRRESKEESICQHLLKDEVLPLLHNKIKINEHLMSEEKFFTLSYVDELISDLITARFWELWAPYLIISSLVSDEVFIDILTLALQNISATKDSLSLKSQEIALLKVLLSFTSCDTPEEMVWVKTKEIRSECKRQWNISEGSFPSSKWINDTLSTIGFIFYAPKRYNGWKFSRLQLIDLIKLYGSNAEAETAEDVNPIDDEGKLIVPVLKGVV